MEMDSGDNNAQFGKFAYHYISPSAAQTLIFQRKHTAMPLKLIRVAIA
jgi:hypothetical protein